MAATSIATYRLMTGIDATIQADESVGVFLGAASAMITGITGRQLGHYVESLTASGADTVATIYGHMLDGSGEAWLFGDGINQKVSYEWIDRNRIRLVGYNAPTNVVAAHLFPQVTGDFAVMSGRIRVATPPIYSVEDVRIDIEWDTQSQATPFSDETIVDPNSYYVAKEARAIFTEEIELKYGLACHDFSMVRVPGYVRAVRRRTRRIARVKYYAGLLAIPEDMLIAIAATAKQVATDPTGEFQSESYDYYSYSRRSLSELRDYPLSVLGTLTRYRVTV